MNKKLENEIKSFQGLWENGYYEGNPLNPLAPSGYGNMGYMSVLHVIYLRCIKPYINAQTVSLEIGPGRGAWTKALLPSKEVWVLDALSAEHNRFFEYLEHPKHVMLKHDMLTHVNYFQVSDFECKMLPNDYFTYMFSFGCLCHISFSGVQEYAKNIFPKLKSGSNCFWMIADFNKYKQALQNNDFNIWRNLLPKFSPLLSLFDKSNDRKNAIALLEKFSDNDDPIPGRWYESGVERTCTMLKEIGYEIIDPDVGVSHRDPIIHFYKP